MSAQVQTTTSDGRRWDDGPRTAIEYLKGVAHMPAWVVNALGNPAQVDRHVDRALQAATVARPLSWGLDMPADLARLEDKFNDNKPSANLPALFVFVTGRPAAGDGCGDERCAKIFGACVVAQEAHEGCLKVNMRRSCASCMFNFQNTRCAFYKAAAAAVDDDDDDAIDVFVDLNDEEDEDYVPEDEMEGVEEPEGGMDEEVKEEEEEEEEEDEEEEDKEEGQ